MPPRTQRKYVPLYWFFYAQPPAVTSLTLTFAEVEAILGAPLPPSARAHRWSWWSNGPQLPQSWPWWSQGWRVAAVEWQWEGPPDWQVRFVRATSEPIASPLAPDRP